MNKSTLIIGIIFILIIFAALGTIVYLKFYAEGAWICQNGFWIKHGNPSQPRPTTDCEKSTNTNVNQNIIVSSSPSPADENTIKVDTPQPNELITSPYTITGQAAGWYFEASFPVKLLDANGQELVTTIAQAQSDWMTTEFVPFKATLEFVIDNEQNGTLVLIKDNPSGLPEHDQKLEIPVKLSATPAMTVKVFFGNEQKNPGALDCSKVFSVDRKIAKTTATAKASLEELLKGPTQAEHDASYFTSINSGVKLQKITIKDGTAYADFDKTLEQSVGGSCRVTAIRSQITQTLKQFSSVKNVIISIDGRTEDILQP
jgi:spore germination protein GerM